MVLCCCFFVRFPSERQQRHLQKAARYFILRSFAPLTVESLARPPLPTGKDRHRNLGLARRRRGTFCCARVRNPKQVTRGREKQKEQSGGNGEWEGLCRVRVVPLEAPSSNCRESCRKRTPANPRVCEREVETPESPPNGVNSVQSVEGGAEKEEEINKGTAPKRPARRKSTGVRWFLFEAPLDVCVCYQSGFAGNDQDQRKDRKN